MPVVPWRRPVCTWATWIQDDARNVPLHAEFKSQLSTTASNVYNTPAENVVAEYFTQPFSKNSCTSSMAFLFLFRMWIIRLRVRCCTLELLLAPAHPGSFQVISLWMVAVALGPSADSVAHPELAQSSSPCCRIRYRRRLRYPANRAVIA